MSYSTTPDDSGIADSLPSVGTAVKWGAQLLFAAFFGWLLSTTVWQAFVEGRTGDAILGSLFLVMLVAGVVFALARQVRS